MGPAPIPLIYEVGAGLVVLLLVALVVGIIIWKRRHPRTPSWPERGQHPAPLHLEPQPHTARPSADSCRELGKPSTAGTTELSGGVGPKDEHTT